MYVPVVESNSNPVVGAGNWYPCSIKDSNGNLIYDKVYMVLTDEYFDSKGVLDFSTKSSHKIAMIKTGLGGVKSKFYTWNGFQSLERGTGFGPATRLVGDSWIKELTLTSEDYQLISKQFVELFYKMVAEDHFITESQKKSQFSKK